MADVLYHGSYNGDIETFEPRVNTTPGGRVMPPSVYATDILSYAIAFGFPWDSNNDHVDLQFIGDKVHLKVPKAVYDRVLQPVFVYTLDASEFKLIPDADPKGHNFVTQKALKPLKVDRYESVESALRELGSIVEMID